MRLTEKSAQLSRLSTDQPFFFPPTSSVRILNTHINTYTSIFPNTYTVHILLLLHRR